MNTVNQVVAAVITWAIIGGLTIAGLTLLTVFTARTITRTRRGQRR